MEMVIYKRLEHASGISHLLSSILLKALSSFSHKPVRTWPPIFQTYLATLCKLFFLKPLQCQKICRNIFTISKSKLSWLLIGLWMQWQLGSKYFSLCAIAAVKWSMTLNSNMIALEVHIYLPNKISQLKSNWKLNLLHLLFLTSFSSLFMLLFLLSSPRLFFV